VAVDPEEGVDFRTGSIDRRRFGVVEEETDENVGDVGG
jgi:hypothetical protein